MIAKSYKLQLSDLMQHLPRLLSHFTKKQMLRKPLPVMRHRLISTGALNAELRRIHKSFSHFFLYCAMTSIAASTEGVA